MGSTKADQMNIIVTALKVYGEEKVRNILSKKKEKIMSSEKVFGVPYLSIQVDKLDDYFKYRISLVDLKHNEILDCMEISIANMVNTQENIRLVINTYKQELIRIFGL